MKPPENPMPSLREGVQRDPVLDIVFERQVTINQAKKQTIPIYMQELIICDLAHILIRNKQFIIDIDYSHSLLDYVDEEHLTDKDKEELLLELKNERMPVSAEHANRTAILKESTMSTISLPLMTTSFLPTNFAMTSSMPIATLVPASNLTPSSLPATATNMIPANNAVLPPTDTNSLRIDQLPMRID